MALEISIRKREGVSIIDLAGRIVLGDGAELLTDAVRKLLEQGKRNLLINLAGVTQVDSCGLGALVASFTSASRQSSKLKLLKPTKHSTDLFRITKLCTVFEIFDDETAAIRSLFETMPAKPAGSLAGPHRESAVPKKATTSSH